MIVDVKDNAKISREEVFGPVVVVHPFDTEEEAIEIANGTPIWARLNHLDAESRTSTSSGRSNGYRVGLGEHLVASETLEHHLVV